MGGGFLLLDYSGRKHLLSTIKVHLGRLIIFGQDEERGLIRSAMYKHGDVIDQLVAYDYDESSTLYVYVIALVRVLSLNMMVPIESFCVVTVTT